VTAADNNWGRDVLHRREVATAHVTAIALQQEFLAAPAGGQTTRSLNSRDCGIRSVPGDIIALDLENLRLCVGRKPLRSTAAQNTMRGSSSSTGSCRFGSISSGEPDETRHVLLRIAAASHGSSRQKDLLHSVCLRRLPPRSVRRFSAAMLIARSTIGRVARWVAAHRGKPDEVLGNIEESVYFALARSAGARLIAQRR